METDSAALVSTINSNERSASSPLVSIIIPSFNSASGTKNIEETLGSIVNQTYKNTEILVVDNFSKDKTFEICRRYPVRFFHFKGNRSEARNYGIDNMSGEYALFLDSDHVLTPAVIEECVSEALLHHSECIIIPVKFLSSVKARLDCSRMRNLDFQLKLGTQTLILFYSKESLRGIRFPETVELGEDVVFSSKVLERKPSVGEIRSVIHHKEDGTARNLILRSWTYGKKFRSTISEVGAGNSTWFILSLSPVGILGINKIVRNVSNSPATVFGFVLYTLLKHLSFGISFCVHSARLRNPSARSEEMEIGPDRKVRDMS